MARRSTTSRQRSASRRNLEKARRARRRRKAVVAGAGLAVGAVGGYVAYKGVKRKHSRDFRSAVRRTMYRDPQHWHNSVHFHAARSHARGKYKPPNEDVLKAQVIFTRKIAQQRVAKRRKMTTKQRRSSIINSRYNHSRFSIY